MDVKSKPSLPAQNKIKMKTKPKCKRKVSSNLMLQTLKLKKSEKISTNPLKTTPKPKIRRNKSNMIKNGSCDRKWNRLFMVKESISPLARNKVHNLKTTEMP